MCRSCSHTQATVAKRPNCISCRSHCFFLPSSSLNRGEKKWEERSRRRSFCLIEVGAMPRLPQLLNPDGAA